MLQYCTLLNCTVLYCCASVKKGMHVYHGVKKNKIANEQQCDKNRYLTSTTNLYHTTRTRQEHKKILPKTLPGVPWIRSTLTSSDISVIIKTK